MIPFLFQDFGSFSLSLFGILYQVDSLSLPLLFGLIGIYPVPLPVGYYSVSSPCLHCCVWGGPFCILAICGVLFDVEFPQCEWGCIGGLSRFLGYGSLCQCSGGWSWISSLWSAMKFPVMGYEMSMVLE